MRKNNLSIGGGGFMWPIWFDVMTLEFTQNNDWSLVTMMIDGDSTMIWVTSHTPRRRVLASPIMMVWLKITKTRRKI